MAGKRKRNDSNNGGVRKKRRTSSFQPSQAAVTKALDVLNQRSGGFVGRELKFVDYTLAARDMTGTWTGGELDPDTALSLSVVAQGDGESQRDGREYMIHSVHVNGMVYQPAGESDTTPNSDAIVRLALVWDTQTNGAQLNAEDVFSTAATSDQEGFRNLQYSKRFIVLKDKRFRVPIGQAVVNEGAINLFASGQVMVPFKFNKRFKTPIKVRTSGTTAVVGGVTDNSLHLVGVYSSPNATALKITYDSRVRFTG